MHPFTLLSTFTYDAIKEIITNAMPNAMLNPISRLELEFNSGELIVAAHENTQNWKEPNSSHVGEHTAHYFIVKFRESFSGAVYQQ